MLGSFKRQRMTSYSSLIGPICKVFQVTALCNMLDLDLTSQGHSRSKPMAPFKRACLTSYSTLIVTMRLSVTIWKIRPFENT